MRLPCKTSDKRESNPLIDYGKAQQIVDMAYQNGVNYFDTAYMYHCGESEKFIGQALRKYPRESYFLADKLPIWMCKTPSDMERILMNNLNAPALIHLISTFFTRLIKEALINPKNSVLMILFLKSRNRVL